MPSNVTLDLAAVNRDDDVIVLIDKGPRLSSDPKLIKKEMSVPYTPYTKIILCNYMINLA